MRARCALLTMWVPVVCFLVELPVKHVHVSPPKPAPLAEEVEEHEELLPDMEEEPLPDDLPDDMEEDNEDEKKKAVGPDCG